MMGALFILGGIVLFAVVALMWHRLGDPTEAPELQKQAEAAERNHRLMLLNKAYILAKEELGEEPTTEQILLTRDQLLVQEALDNGTT